MCSFWNDNYVGARDHDGKDCYGYMDYRDDTDEWSECSVNDFASYVNRQSNFCLQKIKPSSTDNTDKVCQNTLPSDYSNCGWSCDQWAGIGGDGTNYCDNDWTNYSQCVPTTSGKVKDYCQDSCESDTCGCHDVLPTDMLSTCNWTCAQWAGINGNGNNYCEDDWSAKKFCVPYSSGLIKDYCKLSCNNCEKEACRKFRLTSSGPAKTRQSKKFGMYIREENLTNGRVAYFNKKKGEYLYWMNGYWMVGDVKGGDSGGIVNNDCIDVDHPADGECEDGWRYWDGNKFELDSKIRIICKD